MSRASECDRCGELFRREPGVVTIDQISVADHEETNSTWSEIDFCLPCSKTLLALIGRAMQLDEAPKPTIEPGEKA